MGTVDHCKRALSTEDYSELQKKESYDIVGGIPCYNNEKTIKSVVETISRGLSLKFPKKQCLIVVSDGGSEDRTRKRAREANIPDEIDLTVAQYKGISGKGSAFRAIFGAAVELGAEASLLVDSDLRKFPPSWVDSHLSPILDRDMDLMVPSYIRHKYDATITNNVCYPVVSSVFGIDIRQPIGGDFTVSRRLMKYYLEQDVWDTDVARFGIDIWMTTTAIGENFQIGETNLGAKIHDPKDPGESLAPMYKEVVGTLFRQMDYYSKQWIGQVTQKSAPAFGSQVEDHPEPVSVNRNNLEQKAYRGWNKNREIYQKILSPETFHYIEQKMNQFNQYGSLGLIHPRKWTHTLYEFCISYNSEDYDSETVILKMIPLYYYRCYSLFHEMDPLYGEEAEIYLQQLSAEFLEEKPYLSKQWRKHFN